MTTGGGKQISDYGLIGDGETAALVHRDGTIEWLCMPRFDSAACFAALLGDEENGCWQMAPTDPVMHSSRRYLGDTLVLETLFETTRGVAAVIDFMPQRGEAPDIVRIVEGRSGTVEICSRLAARFGYGRTHPLVRTRPDQRTLAIAGPDGIALGFDVPIHFTDRWFESRFTVSEGERRRFVMTHYRSESDAPAAVNPDEALEDTCRYWQDWTSRIDYRGIQSDLAMRALITLKALIHRPTGSIIAAPTASLPEEIGGSRNWDYRFCWLRDATFTLLAMIEAGLVEEAEAWVAWLRRAVAGEPVDLQPFYTVTGDRHVLEWEASWLPGFEHSTPVRFGNGAAGQLQLDIYGEVIDALAVAERHGIGNRDDADALVGLLADRAADLWRQPDAGMWESRGNPRHHVYSKAMCWVAFDRAAQWFANDDPDRSGRYRHLADQVHAEILDRGVDPDRGCFTQAYGESALDAATLRLPLVGFLPADDERMVNTVAAIEAELVQHGLVHRYATKDAQDGVQGGEGAFLPATFWLADVLLLQERRDDANGYFKRAIGLVNDLGLISEESDGKQLLGNFPQGLTHLALLITAMNLSEGGGPAHRRTPARER